MRTVNLGALSYWARRYDSVICCSNVHFWTCCCSKCSWIVPSCSV